MVTEGPAQDLHGRRVEREVLDRLLGAVRGGQSQVLVVSGEPGVGKTALLEYAIGTAPGFRVVRAAGVEWEMELAFAALHQFCAPILDRLDRLPPPQQDALGVAFGLRAGDAPDRFLVGLAVLSLLSEVAEEQPLLCVVDDAHWLDRASAQALAFVARRLLAESVALLLATRDAGDELDGLPKLALEGLPTRDAYALLSAELGVPLDEQVRERLVAETRGNPLALLELPRGLTPAELAGGFGLPDAPALSGRIEGSFQRRFGGLAGETQRLLLVAAAEPVGDPVLVWRAAERLGISGQAAADTDGLLTMGARVTFRHPLVRSAVYRSASPEDRHAVHRALAEATDPEVDRDRRAWHLAQATSGLDEDVASELERSAGRAQARGGFAAAAAFLERAAALTPKPSRQAERALAAAQAKHMAGAPDAALELLGSAAAGPLDELRQAQVDLMRGQIAFALSRGSEAPPLLLSAAKRLEPLDVTAARETYLELIAAALFAGPLATSAGVVEAATAARAAPPAPAPARACDLLLDGFALLITDGYHAGAPILKEALVMFRSGNVTRNEELRWLWLACQTAMDLWDDESWDILSGRFAQLVRNDGALALLPLALSARVGILVYAAELGEAAALIEEIEAVSAVTGSQLGPYGALALAAWQGRISDVAELIEVSMAEVVNRGEGIALGSIRWAQAFLHNCAGRYEEALAAAEQAVDYPVTLLYARWGLIELIEAASLSGRRDTAAGALARLSEGTQASGSDWALGIEARSRALTSEDDNAEPLYREAIDRLRRTRVRTELARTHLLYGEWLGGQRRRSDAREQLRTADEMVTRMGIDSLAERIRRELPGSGGRARKRTVETRDDLTAQEAQISRLAADGATNQDIAAQLFISPSTVDYHLRKAFRKLGVKSRHQLEQHLLQPGARLEPGSGA
jgi:DNA-binding CsgD family transcriptional regulator